MALPENVKRSVRDFPNFSKTRPDAHSLGRLGTRHLSRRLNQNVVRYGISSDATRYQPTGEVFNVDNWSGRVGLRRSRRTGSRRGWEMRWLNVPLLGMVFAVGALSGQLQAADDLRSPTVEVTVVDDADQPIAGATVRVQITVGAEMVVASDETTLASDAKGIVRVPRPFDPEGFQLTFLAADAAGDRQGYLAWPLRGSDDLSKSRRLVLKTARDVAVRVVDKAGDPVADATVGILHQTMQTLTHGRTNDAGTVRLRYPAEAPLHSAFAFASGQGFDNWKASTDATGGERGELPAELSFTLTGAQSVRVRAVDSAGKPVGGLSIFSPLIRSPSRPMLNQAMVRCRLGDARTDEEGIATIDWLPADVLPAPFLIRSDRFALRDSRTIPRALLNGGRDLTVEVRRMTSVSGKVTQPDASPAGAVVILAQGSNGSTQTFHAAAQTAVDGTYSVLLEPGLVYAVAIASGDGAAVSRMGIRVDEDQPVAGVDFRLGEGTILRGKVISEPASTPASQRIVYLTEIGEPVAMPGSARPARMNVLRSSQADVQGNYRFRVGPGTYELKSDRGRDAPPPIVVKVANEREIVRDVGRLLPETKTEGQRKIALSGKIVGPDGKPVAGAMVLGNYVAIEFTGGRRTDVTAKSEADGTFRVERLSIPMSLFASSADGALAARVALDDAQPSVTIELAPAGIAVGRLIDGDVPLAGLTLSIDATVRFPGPMGQSQSHPVPVRTITTGSDGRLLISGLIAGETCMVAVGDRRGGADEPPTISMPSRAFPLIVKKSGKFDLGYINAPAMRLGSRGGVRWRYADIAARASNLFDVKANFADRVAEAADDARREQRRTMLVLGDPLAEGTRSLLKILDGIDGDDDYEVVQKRRQEQRGGGPADVDEFARPMADFRRVHVDIKKDQAAVAHLAGAYRIDVAKIGLPALAILHDERRLAALRWFPPTGDPPKIDREALRDFIREHTLPVRDAKELLDAALRRAREEKKRVLVLQTGTDSYPSRLMSRFIAAQSDLLDRDYVRLEIDAFRMAKATEVIPLFRETTGSLPWVAIVEADGTKLVDSDSSEGNIGYPAEPEAIDYFIDKMVKPTARRLKSNELEELRKALPGK